VVNWFQSSVSVIVILEVKITRFSITASSKELSRNKCDATRPSKISMAAKTGNTYIGPPYIYLRTDTYSIENSNGTSRVFEHGKLEESVCRRLIVGS